MTYQKTVTISARVSLRVREMGQAVARLRGITVSRFAGEAIEHAARRELTIDVGRRRASASDDDHGGRGDA